MGKNLGVTLTVDNQTGGGILGHQAIADANTDGYTIGMITFELATYKKLGTSELTWENYAPLCRVNTDAAAITVAQSGLLTTASPTCPVSLITARLTPVRCRWAVLPTLLSGTSLAAT